MPVSAIRYVSRGKAPNLFGGNVAKETAFAACDGKTFAGLLKILATVFFVQVWFCCQNFFQNFFQRCISHANDQHGSTFFFVENRLQDQR